MRFLFVFQTLHSRFCHCRTVGYTFNTLINWVISKILYHALEKAMAIHSSVLAWRIPGTGEPGGLRSMGPHRVRHDWSDLAAAAKRPLTVCQLLWEFLAWDKQCYQRHIAEGSDLVSNIWSNISLYTILQQAPITLGLSWITWGVFSVLR